ncbi:aspartate/glutamate racemase family protein [Granulosicoccus sp.]|nr:aspartate/glutamate racemase family protein [Granulosicoccus sp.]MDB4224490.1 aspartate/glutamate racemase family protein [Granulosicoccus sp.]
MRLLIINPNTTASMTAKIGIAAEGVALSSTIVTAVNPSSGPASIQGYYDEAASLAGILGIVKENPDADAIIVACFDDTGLDAVRCATEAPVLGIGEAAYHAASVLSNRFSVVTTLARSVPALEHNLVRYGLATRCGGVRSSEVAVLDLEKPGSDARDKISKEIACAIVEDRAEAIVLGCAGMTDLAQSLSVEHGLPVLDGVVCAVTWAESLVRAGLKTSQLGGYAPSF